MADTAVVVVTREHETLVPLRRRADGSHLLRVHRREVEGIDGRTNQPALGRPIPDSMRGNALTVEG